MRDKLFMATKVWTSGRDAGIRQMETSFKRLRVERMDLMQVHNLVDVDTHTKTLQDWKAKKRVRYIGITHYTSSAYAEVERQMLKTAVRLPADQLLARRARIGEADPSPGAENATWR